MMIFILFVYTAFRKAGSSVSCQNIKGTFSRIFRGNKKQAIMKKNITTHPLKNNSERQPV